jgi:hypothetical protein
LAYKIQGYVIPKRIKNFGTPEMEFTTDNKLITFDDCNSSKSSFMFDISKSTIPASKFIGIDMPGLEIPPKQGEVDYYLSPIIGRKIKNQRFS